MARDVPPFGRAFWSSSEPIARLGDGELGGKALGLVRIRDLLEKDPPARRFPDIEVYVPRMVVIATDVFDAFLRGNDLRDLTASEPSDDRLCQAFLKAELPAGVVGDLRALVEDVRTPLAVRSSSRLEDALLRPFAGVYETKMVPNNQPDADSRFVRLMEAIKFVWASTYFTAARSYVRATGGAIADEKMAVIVQEVVGRRYGERFYPNVSGVARSYNFFPSRGVSPRDGVVNLALGLGKTIVDGGSSWVYSPARPGAPPPFGSVGEMLKKTQLRFWAVNMGQPPAYDPMTETEYLVECDLAAADYDGTLSQVASTYDPERDRVVPGTGGKGPRIVDFAPLLGDVEAPVNDVIGELLARGERSLEAAVEMELALTLPARGLAGTRIAVLQLRPMLVSEQRVELTEDELGGPELLLSSVRVMGNGAPGGIRDIVYVAPEAFEARFTPLIAKDIDRMNTELEREGRPYLLIGFGRWGSSDPWLGIPVAWAQIAGARVIVESTTAGMNVEASQGAHFFHNILAADVLYLCVGHAGDAGGVDWPWLAAQPALRATDRVRHLRLDAELRVKVDGRSGRGAVWRPPGL